MDPPAWTKPWTQGQSRTEGPSPAKKTYTDQASAARDHPAPPHFNVEVRTAGVHFRLRKNAHLRWRPQGFAGNIETRGYGSYVMHLRRLFRLNGELWTVYGKCAFLTENGLYSIGNMAFMEMVIFLLGNIFLLD